MARYFRLLCTFDNNCSYFDSYREEEISRIITPLSQPDANVNTKDRHNLTPLHHLAYFNADVLQFQKLLAHPDIDVNIQDLDGSTPLHYAILHASEPTVELLLAHPKTDVNLLNINNEVALHYVNFFRSAHTMELLLARPEVEVNVQNTRGETPLHFASRYEQFDEVELLLAHPDIDTSIKDENGETALKSLLNEETAKWRNPMVKLFLEAGAYTPDELDLIKKKYPEVWNDYERKFYQVQKALDEGPLAGLPSVISSLIAETLHPGVLFWKAISEA